MKGSEKPVEKTILDAEKSILAKLIYRSKNQHKSSPMLRRMIQLSRLMRDGAVHGPARTKILAVSQDLYIACSSSLCMGYFVPISICVMSVAARIFYLVSRMPSQGRSQIDLIFG